MSRSALRIVLSLDMLRPLPFAQQCRLARELGYEGVQVSPLADPQQPVLLSDADSLALREAAAAEGVEITGLHLQLPAGLSLAHADAQVQQQALALMAGACEQCVVLGGRYVAHTQQRGAPPRDGSEEAWDRARESIAGIGEVARERGILYCLAPTAMEVAATLEDAVRMLDAIENPALRTMLDTASAAGAEGEPLEDLMQRYMPMEYLVHVQLQEPGGKGPGQGEFNFAPVLRALLQMQDFGNYAGVIAVTAEAPQAGGIASAGAAMGFVRGVLQGLRG